MVGKYTLWNYNSFLCQSDFTINTNALGNLNGKLKFKCGTGYLSRNNSFKRVKEFYIHYITEYTAKVVHNRMPSIKAKYLKRENSLKEKFEEFHDLSLPDQMESLEYYYTEWGLYTSNMDAADFGKVPGLELNEIQEAKSESFLSFREILNQ